MRIDAFTVGTPVVGEKFYGRQDELTACEAHRWVWLCGPRRIGKTSLMLRVQENILAADGVALFLDLSAGEIGNTKDLLRIFLRQNQRAIIQHANLQIESLERMSAADALYKVVIELQSSYEQVTFLWDETELLIPVAMKEPTFLSTLRGQLHANPNFRFIIAGTQGLTALFPEDDEQTSTFLGTFKWLPLAALDLGNSLRLLNCEQVGGWDTEPERALIEDAADWTGGHPIVLQELGSNLYEQTKGDARTITEQTIWECQKKIRRNITLQKIFSNDQLKLTKPQRAVLRTVCESNEKVAIDVIALRTSTSRARVTAAVDYLEEFGYLQQNGTVSLRYKFYPDFLNLSETSVTESAVVRIKPTLFVSYCHHDREYFDTLQKFLRPLFRRKQLLCLWTDEEIELGGKWVDSIKEAILRADVALFLVTQNFLNSQYITQHEAPAILRKQIAGKVRAIPLYCETSNVTATPYRLDNDLEVLLSSYQGPLPPDRPMEKLPLSERNEVMSAFSIHLVDTLAKVRH